MVVTVHRGLRKGVSAPDCKGGLEPWDFDHFFQRFAGLDQSLIEVRKALLRIGLQRRRIRKGGDLFGFELRCPRSGNPQKGVLYQMDVMKPLKQCLVGQGGWVPFEGTPMLGVGPLLMGIKVQPGMNSRFLLRV
jgi:hypothetical protein